MLIKDQHLIGQLVDYEQIRGVGVLLTGFADPGTVIRARRRGRLLDRGADIRRRINRPITADSGDRDGALRRIGQLVTVRDIGRLVAQQHTGLGFRRIPASPPPREDHRGHHRTERDRHPGQS